MIFIIIFLLQWFTRINGQSYYAICGSYSGTHYSDAFLSGVRTTGTYYSDAHSGTYYSDAFLSRARETGTYSGTHYSDAFLSSKRETGTYSETHYSDAFLSSKRETGTYSGTYSGTYYSNAFLSSTRETGTYYSDAFLSREQCILSRLYPKSSSNTKTQSHIASSNKENQYISYIGSNNFVSISKNVFSYLSISKYYNSHITGTSKHVQYISYIGSNNIGLMSKNKYSYYSSIPLPSPMPIITPLIMPSQMPLIMPSQMPVITPSPMPVITPSQTPVIMPSQTPLSMPSPMPSLVPIISFDTKISFSNYNSVELDSQSQNVVIVATSSSMNISASFVKYIGTSLQARRVLNLLFFKTQGYNIIVLLQTTIPLSGTFAKYKTNPTQLFSALTAKMVSSVSSGDFAQYLQAKSPSFANTTILSVENDNYVIVEPRPKKKDNFKTDVLSIIYVILFSICVVIIIKIGYMIRKRLKRQVVNRQIQEPFYSNQI